MLLNFGNVYLRTGNLAQALKSYEEALAIARRLAAADPGNTQWQRDVSFSLNRIGDVRRAAGDQAGALQAYEEGLAIMRRLVAADPGNTQWQTDLVVSLTCIARASLDARRQRAAFEEALRILATLEERDALTADQKGWRQWIEAELAKLNGAERLRARP